MKNVEEVKEKVIGIVRAKLRDEAENGFDGYYAIYVYPDGRISAQYEISFHQPVSQFEGKADAPLTVWERRGMQERWPADAFELDSEGNPDYDSPVDYVYGEEFEDEIEIKLNEYFAAQED